MTVFQQEPPMTNVGGGAFRVWLEVDDRGTPDDANRWRLSRVHATNQGTVLDRNGIAVSGWWYVQDPTNPANVFWDVIGPGEDRFYDIPNQYKNVDPWTFSWGSGFGLKPPFIP